MLYNPSLFIEDTKKLGIEIADDKLPLFEKLAYLYKEEGVHRIRTMRPSTVG